MNRKILLALMSLLLVAGGAIAESPNSSPSPGCKITVSAAPNPEIVPYNGKFAVPIKAEFNENCTAPFYLKYTAPPNPYPEAYSEKQFQKQPVSHTAEPYENNAETGDLINLDIYAIDACGNTAIVRPTVCLNSKDNSYCAGQSEALRQSQKTNTLYRQGSGGGPLPVPIVYIDPDYRETMKKEKNFTPTLPFNPFQDIIVEIRYCTIGWKEITPTLMTTDVQGREIEILKGEFQETLGKTGTYQWKIDGYPNGITPDEQKMEILADNVGKGRDVFVRLEKAGDKTQKKIEMTDCVQMHGSGNLKTNIYRYDPSHSIPETMNYTNRLIDFGFKAIDPYKSSIKKFGFYTDIKISKEGEKNSCGIGRINVQLVNKKNNFKSCHAVPGSKTIVVGEQRCGYNISMAMHEITHLFGVNDEYYLFQVSPGPLTNCSRNPNAGNVDYKQGGYMYQGISYGDTYKGCGGKLHLITDNLTGKTENVQGTTLYRPSPTSLMYDHYFPKLNDISCGYVRSDIEGRNPQENWKECSKLDTIHAKKLGAECTIDEDCTDAKGAIGCKTCTNNKCVNKEQSGALCRIPGRTLKNAQIGNCSNQAVCENMKEGCYTDSDCYDGAICNASTRQCIKSV